MQARNVPKITTIKPTTRGEAVWRNFNWIREIRVEDLRRRPNFFLPEWRKAVKLFPPMSFSLLLAEEVTTGMPPNPLGEGSLATFRFRTRVLSSVIRIPAMVEKMLRVVFRAKRVRCP